MIRTFLSVLMSTAVVFGLPSYAQYPTKPIHIIAPYAPGGVGDISARLLAAPLSTALGQQVLVENKTGAATQIGTDYVAKAAPDGYTLLMGAATLATNPYLYSKLPYDLSDLQPIILVIKVPTFLLVNSSIPARDLKEFIQYVKRTPKLRFSSAGNGSIMHLAGEWFKTIVGFDALHVPYKGSAPAVADLAAGRVEYNFENLGPAMPFLKGGKVRALAVASSSRASAMPDVPTFAEQGTSGFEASSWGMLLAPAKTPNDIVTRINRESAKILQSAQIKAKFTDMGIEPGGGTEQDATAFIASEASKWGRLIKQSGAKAD